MMTLQKSSRAEPKGHDYTPEEIEGMETSGREAAKSRTELEQAAAAFVKFGGAAGRDVILTRAAIDPRMNEGHLRVLLVYSHMMNDKKGTAWPAPEVVGDLCGLGKKTVQNINSQLVAWGYIYKSDGRWASEHGVKKNEVAFRSPDAQDWSDWHKALATIEGLLSVREALLAARLEAHAKPTIKRHFPQHGKSTSRSEGNADDAFPVARERNSLLGNTPPSLSIEGNDRNLTTEEVKRSAARSEEGSSGEVSAEKSPETEAQQLEPAEPKREIAVSAKVEPLALRSDDLHVGGLDFPQVIAAAIDGGASLIQQANLREAIRDALRRGVSPETIISDMRKAASDADAKAEEGGKATTPNAILRLVVRYLENSRADDKAESKRSINSPTKAANPDEWVANFGGKVLRKRVQEIADRAGVGYDEVANVVTDCAALLAQKAKPPFATMEEIGEHFAKIGEKRRAEALIDVKAWRAILTGTYTDERLRSIGAARMEAFELAKRRVEKRLAAANTGEVPRWAEDNLPFAFNNALDHARFEVAHREYLLEITTRLGVYQSDISRVKAIIALIGEPVLSLKFGDFAALTGFVGTVALDNDLRTKTPEEYRSAEEGDSDRAILERPLLDVMREVVKPNERPAKLFSVAFMSGGTKHVPFN